MKKTITTAAFGTILTLGTASAVVTTINLTDVGAITGVSSIGTFVTDTAASSGSPSTTATFTISDLDLVGDGTFNDSFTFITTVAVGGIAGNIGLNDNLYQHKNSTSNNLLNGADETLTVTINAGSVILGDAGGPATSIVFNGFTAIRLASATASEGMIYTDPDPDVVIKGTQTYTLASPDLDGFTVSGFGPAGTTNQVRLGGSDFSYTITSVPEPTSATLLGFGGLALILRRRK